MKVTFHDHIVWNINPSWIFSHSILSQFSSRWLLIHFAILKVFNLIGRFQQVELEDGSTAFVCLPEAFVACIPEKQDDEQHSDPIEQEEQQDQLSPSQSEARNKCFMCTHEGCGKYYTTLHHLKVSYYLVRTVISMNLQ